MLSQTINWDNKFKRTSELDDRGGEKKSWERTFRRFAIDSSKLEGKEPKTDGNRNNKKTKQKNKINFFTFAYLHFGTKKEVLLMLNSYLQVRSRNFEAVVREPFL